MLKHNLSEWGVIYREEPSATETAISCTMPLSVSLLLPSIFEEDSDTKCSDTLCAVNFQGNEKENEIETVLKLVQGSSLHTTMNPIRQQNDSLDYWKMECTHSSFALLRDYIESPSSNDSMASLISSEKVSLDNKTISMNLQSPHAHSFCEAVYRTKKLLIMLQLLRRTNKITCSKLKSGVSDKYELASISTGLREASNFALDSSDLQKDVKEHAEEGNHETRTSDSSQACTGDKRKNRSKIELKNFFSVASWSPNELTIRYPLESNDNGNTADVVESTQEALLRIVANDVHSLSMSGKDRLQNLNGSTRTKIKVFRLEFNPVEYPQVC